MGTCKYCGQSAGLFSKVHKACEDKHQQGMAELLAAMHSYFKGKDSIQTVLSKIAVGQQDCYLQTSDIEDCASKALDLFCEQIKFPVTKQYLAIIETFLNNVKVSRMGLNKDGSLDRLAMKLHQGVLVSHFAESIDMPKVEKRLGVVERLLPLSSSQREEIGMKVLDKAANKYLANGLLSDQEQRDIEDFAHALALPINNLTTTYQGSALEKIAQCSILKQIQRGQLPPSMPISAPIMLNAGETVIWAYQNIKLFQEKIGREWVGRNRGFSFRVMKGVYYRTGGSRGHAVEHCTMKQEGVGSLIFTNKNLIFYSQTKSVKVPYKKILSVVPYSDGLEIQRDGANSKRLTFQGFDSWFVVNLLSSINI